MCSIIDIILFDGIGDSCNCFIATYYNNARPPRALNGRGMSSPIGALKKMDTKRPDGKNEHSNSL